MRKTLFVLLAVAIVAAMGSPALAQDDDDQGDGIGAKIAGAWLGMGWFEVDLGTPNPDPEGPPFVPPCDGIYDTPHIPFTDAQMFGVGGDRAVTNPANPNSGLGTWEKTGPRQVTGRDINFGAFVGLITIVVDFDKGFETATTTFEGKFYTPPDDPLDPDAIPAACSRGVHESFRKVSATE